MATMGFQCRELELNTELMEHLNDAQAAKVIREVEMYHNNTVCALKQGHWDNMLALECEAKVTEEQDCPAFAEAFGVQPCKLLHLSPMGALLYPVADPYSVMYP